MQFNDDDRRMAKAACIGAAGALVLAMFTPAAVLLGAGLVAAGGVYAYRRYTAECGGKDGTTGHSEGENGNKGGDGNANGTAGVPDAVTIEEKKHD